VNISWYGGVAGDANAIALEPSWQFYARELFLTAWSPIALLGILGLAGIVRENWRLGLVVLAFPISYGALIALQTSHFARMLVPFAPFLALGAGTALSVATDKLNSWSPAARIASTARISILVVLVGILPFLATLRADWLLSREDVRTEAYDWFKTNVAPEAKVTTDPTGPPLVGWSRDIYLTWNLAEHQADWYVDQKFDYIVISEPRLLDPNLTLQLRSAYRSLMNRFALVKTFEGPMLGTPNIHIWVYRVAP
jgi:hypothetical protein